MNKILTLKIYFAILLATINNSATFYIGESNSVDVYDQICQRKLTFYEEIGCKPLGNSSVTCATK